MNILKETLSRGLFKYAFIFVIIVSSLWVMYPFASAILLGALLALAFSSLKSYLMQKGLSQRMTLNVMLLGILTLVLAPTVLFFIRGSKLVTQYLKDPQFLNRLKDVQAQMVSYFARLGEIVGLSADDMNAYVHDYSDRIAKYLFEQISDIVTQLPEIGLFLLVMVTAIYFFLNYEKQIRHMFDEHAGMKFQNSNEFIAVLKSSSQSVFFASVITGLIQATAVCAGSLIFGVGDWFLVLFVTFVCSFVPIIGAGPVAFALAIYAFSSGMDGAAIGLIVISIVSGTIDNVIRPYLATRGEVEVPAVIGILAVIGGVTVWGLKGLFLGPFVASLFFGALPILLRDHFGDRAVSNDSDGAFTGTTDSTKNTI